MVTYSVFLALQFLMQLSGIVATVRLLFDIQTGLFDADVIPELAMYEQDPWVRYKWDTLQSEFETLEDLTYQPQTFVLFL